MSLSSILTSTIPPVLFSRADEARVLREFLDDFERLATTSDQLVSAPTDAVRVGDKIIELPRYAYLGGEPGGAVLKLAVYAGWSAGDVAPTYALLETVRHLLRRPEEGRGYVLSLYPLVHASAFDTEPASAPRDLARVRWNAAAGTEIERLAGDFRTWGFDGWISIRRRTGGDFVRATARGLPVDPDFFPVEQGRYHIVWLPGRDQPPGPFDLAGELSHRPFGLELDVPAHWPDGLFAGAVSATVRAFLSRYREARAYGQHL